MAILQIILLFILGWGFFVNLIFAELVDNPFDNLEYSVEQFFFGPWWLLGSLLGFAMYINSIINSDFLSLIPYLSIKFLYLQGEVIRSMLYILVVINGLYWLFFGFGRTMYLVTLKDEPFKKGTEERTIQDYEKKNAYKYIFYNIAIGIVVAYILDIKYMS